MLKPKEQWAVVTINYDGSEYIADDGDHVCIWDDPTPASGCIERMREDMRKSRKIAKRLGGNSGYEGIRGYRIAHLMLTEIPKKKRKRGMREISWKRAEKVAGRRLDRRKKYALDSNGVLCFLGHYKTSCSNCTEFDDFSEGRRGAGCEECGGKGMRRHAEWFVLDPEK